MRLWRWVLLLLLVAALAAFGWHWVAADPGYVLVRLRGWRLQTSLVVAIVVLLLAWAVISLAWRLIRWPFGALDKRRRRVGTQRMAQGLVALHEGRHGEAERALGRAARHSPLRSAALLAAADAARRRGATERALETLDEASQQTPQAARVLRARTLREAGRQDEAMTLLAPEADSGRLAPAGWREWVLATLAAHQPERARAGLEPLRKSGALSSAAYQALETRVLRACLDAAPGIEALQSLWRSLTRHQRGEPTLIAGYARRASRFGAGLSAMDEIEGALKRNWNEDLLRAYGELEGDDTEPRIQRAEQWLQTHPDDPLLLATLGRLYARHGLWGKAREHLQRALSLRPSPQAWEALGDVAAGQKDASGAARCYRNALRLERGETVEQLPGFVFHDEDGAPAAEERNAAGLPRLPQAR